MNTSIELIKSQIAYFQDCIEGNEDDPENYIMEEEIEALEENLELMEMESK